MREWIGVDLDGTIAVYDGGFDIEHIGDPIPLMIERVKHWISKDIKVKIFTARCSVPGHVKPIHKWLKEQGLPELEVTNIKDLYMLELWDDRSRQVIKNTGERVG